VLSVGTFYYGVRPFHNFHCLFVLEWANMAKNKENVWENGKFIVQQLLKKLSSETLFELKI